MYFQVKMGRSGRKNVLTENETTSKVRLMFVEFKMLTEGILKAKSNVRMIFIEVNMKEEHIISFFLTTKNVLFTFHDVLWFSKL